MECLSCLFFCIGPTAVIIHEPISVYFLEPYWGWGYQFWSGIEGAIQSAVGEHLSGAQADALDALLGRLIAAKEGS